MEETKAWAKRLKPSWPQFLVGLLALAVMVLVTRPLWGNAMLDEPFLRAVIAKDSRSAEVWLKRGADINSKWDERHSVVEIAMHNEDKVMAAILLRHGNALSTYDQSQLQELIDPSLHKCSFVRQAWLEQKSDSAAQARKDMIQDLIEFHLPTGMAKNEVIALLGDPDQGFGENYQGEIRFDPITKQPVNDFEGGIAYYVGSDTTSEGSSFGFTLEVAFDTSERVCAKGWGGQ